MDHELYMQRALALAARGAGWVNPNPQVGAVIVSNDGQVIGEGWHTAFGKLHAEREALADAARRDFSTNGATIYVTLEPCCHTGKQPPCTQALIDAGIKRVVMGAYDPNPLVSGKGIRQLQEAGIEVVRDVMTGQCEQINRAWLHYIQTKRPFITLKYAMTLDGKIATRSGDSKWVTGEVARKRVHEGRAKAAGILVGIGTVLADNPQLTARDTANPNPHQPARFIMDTRLRTPLESKIAASAGDIPTYIICGSNADAIKRSALEEAGCRIWDFNADALTGAIDVQAVIERMGQTGIDSLIVEGGATTAGAFVDAGCVDFVQAYIAPKITGGQGAANPIAGRGAKLMAHALPLQDPQVEQLGGDLLVSGPLAKPREV